MPALSINERGILFMVAATASFAACDTFLKLAAESLPPFETIFIRSTFAVLWTIPFLLTMGGPEQARAVFQKRVIIRSTLEMAGALGYIFGLANLNIADFTALIQLSPILVMLAAGVFLRLPVTRLQLTFAIVAFIGALFVVQPGGTSFSVYAFFGIWTAVLTAARELVGRTVPAEISGIVVALGAALFSTFGAGAATLVFETFRLPGLTDIGLIAASALFLMSAQIFIFMAYRHAAPGAVAPFFYVGALWAVLSSGLVFGALPNAFGFVGIAFIVISGVSVLLLTARQPKGPASES